MSLPTPADRAAAVAMNARLGVPDRIGPYRVMRRLGAGGMGEIFLAHDERLDRDVALKRVRSRAAVRGATRERLRREARLTARLNHEAAVRIYDVLEWGSEDYLVMEYVEGVPLRTLLDAEGRLPLPQVARLGHDVACGLAEAHAHGVVHRDLKSENVLVTPEGRAKILDFGIAHHLDPAGELGEPTSGQTVIGTYRAMSPEQAMGKAVDHRSDLFSLGALLYEMTTGSSPFDAGRGRETLRRVVTHHPPAVRELRHEAPPELGTLIDDLLAKDPDQRPADAREVAAVLGRLAGVTVENGQTLEAAGGVATERWPARPVADPTTGSHPSAAVPTAPADGRSGARRRLALAAAAVAVVVLAALALAGPARRLLMAPEAPRVIAVLPAAATAPGLGEAELALVEDAVRVGLLQGLGGLEGVVVKEARADDELPADPAAAALALAADELVVPRLDCRPGSCQVALDRLRGADGGILWTESIGVPTDEPALVAGALLRQVRRGYADLAVRQEAGSGLAVSQADFAEFLELRQRFDQRRDADLRPLLDGLAAIRARSPEFLEVHLLEGLVARVLYHDSRDPADLARARRLADRARELAPGDPRPHFLEVEVELAAGDTDAAAAAVERLQGLVPGDPALLDRRARLAQAEGRLAEALALEREAVERHPSARRLLALAIMEWQQGEIAEARGHLEELLERSPDDYAGLAHLAQLELTHGNPRRAVFIYRGLVERSPGLSELSNLGIAHFLLGQYAEAAEQFERALEAMPSNPFFTLNLADARQLEGLDEEAQQLYLRVVELTAEDPGEPEWQILTVRAQALAQLGRGREAVAAVQEALRRSPDNASTAYEAALVYALLGETTSALVNAEAALSRGYQVRWFSFPWFDDLRREPEFQDLLGAEAGEGTSA